MKTTNFIWTCLIVLGMFFANTSCSSDNEPEVEPEEEVILTPIPEGAEPGKVYAISHDKKNDKCVFQFYFGDNSTEELKEKNSNCIVTLKALDAAGNELYNAGRGLHPIDLDLPWGGDTFELPCSLCERIRQFEYNYLFPYDVDSERWKKYGEETYTQQYRSPHSFTDK